MALIIGLPHMTMAYVELEPVSGPRSKVEVPLERVANCKHEKEGVKLRRACHASRGYNKQMGVGGGDDLRSPVWGY